MSTTVMLEMELIFFPSKLLLPRHPPVTVMFDDPVVLADTLHIVEFDEPKVILPKLWVAVSPSASFSMLLLKLIAI